MVKDNVGTYIKCAFLAQNVEVLIHTQHIRERHKGDNFLEMHK